LFYLAKDGGHIVIIIIWKTQWRLHAQKAATLLLGVAKCFCAAILKVLLALKNLSKVFIS